MVLVAIDGCARLGPRNPTPAMDVGFAEDYAGTPFGQTNSGRKPS
jgi:hypothetical protein